MFYIILGIVLVVTISALIGKKNATSPNETEESLSSASGIEQNISSQGQENKAEIKEAAKNEKASGVSDKRETNGAKNAESMVAPPLTSPGISASTIYSAEGEIIRAPDSVKRDAYGLHWSGKSSELNVNGIVIRGAMIYWADGKPGIDEPSCIDITLPIEVTDTGHVKDGAQSYAMMTPSQRGGYLMWLAGGRNLMPYDPSWVYLWFLGIERRAFLDKQDIPLCIVESLRMLPFAQNEKLYNNMQKLSIWLTLKFMLPEEQILKLIQNMKEAPIEFFDIILSSYSNAKLPLPSYLAYIIMCSSPIAGKTAPYKENLINAFAGIYKHQTDGGLVLKTPHAKIPLTYIIVNNSIADSKRKQEIIDLPDFFKDATQFNPLISVWNEFIKKYEENCFEEDTDEPEIKHTDWEPFVQENLKGGELPLLIKLSALASFLGIDQTEKPSSAQRKEMTEIARLEGYLIVPELCISGKEYKWDDFIALTPIVMGEKISDDYNSAALMFEFIAALAGENSKIYGGVQELLNTTIKYFSLINEELARLKILPGIFDANKETPLLPDNLGECLQAWLKTDEREYVRNVIFEMLKLSKGHNPDETDENDNIRLISEKLHQLLDVKTESLEKIKTVPPITGEKLVGILSTLFKNK